MESNFPSPRQMASHFFLISSTSLDLYRSHRSEWLGTETCFGVQSKYVHCWWRCPCVLGPEELCLWMPLPLGYQSLARYSLRSTAQAPVSSTQMHLEHNFCSTVSPSPWCCSSSWRRLALQFCISNRTWIIWPYSLCRMHWIWAPSGKQCSCQHYRIQFKYTRCHYFLPRSSIMQSSGVLYKKSDSCKLKAITKL